MSSSSLVAHEGIQRDRVLAAEVLAHLDAQIDSARSLLELVLEQGAAIRARDVHTVVRLAGILRGEMGRRQLLEEERARLLARSGERLGVAPEAVTLALLSALMDDASVRAREHSQRRAAGPAARAPARAHGKPHADADRTRLPRPPDGHALARRGQRLRHARFVQAHHAVPPTRRPARTRPAGLAEMTIPTLQGLQTALSGLLAEQTALDTTGNNIANASTEGYSRETALLEPNPALPIPAISGHTGEGAQLGTGVTVATIARIRNTYLDAQYRTQNSSLSGAKTQAEIARARADLVQRTVDRGDRDAAVELLVGVEQPRKVAVGRSRQTGGRRRGRTAREGFQRTQHPAHDGLDAGGRTVQLAHGPLRGSRRLREPDRAAERADQARRRSRATAEQPARPTRPAARQALHPRQRHGHRTARPHRHGDARRRRQAARRRHDRQLAAGTDGSRRRRARRTAQPHRPQGRS